MAMSVDHFIEALARSGLLSADDARATLRGLPVDQQPVTGEDFADLLIQAKKLTAFQAKCLLRGRTLRLVLDEYVILDRIGAGGMGQVFKAMHTHMDRIVALKVMNERALDSPESIERFDREVKTAARLSHPNIVTAFDAGHSDGVHYLVMEFVDGHDLGSLTEDGPLAVDAAVNCATQAAAGLQYAHSEGIIHRDIKPGNLLLDKHETVRILDMGIARIETPRVVDQDAATEAKLTQAGVIMGSIDFMAPEQAANAENADARSDIYSLGCTLFYLLTGREVFRGDTVVEKLFARHEQEIPMISNLRDDVPDAFDSVIKKMIAKRPEDRYQTMNEVIGALDLFRDISHGASVSADVVTEGQATTVQAASGESGPPTDDSASPNEKARLWRRSPACDELYKIIEGRGTPDKFIDIDEEDEIFRKGGDLRLSSKDVEEVLSQMCRQEGWVRQRRLSDELAAQLQISAANDAAIQQDCFDTAVRYAVKQGMRRKLAIEECLTLILNNDWEVQELDDNLWYSKKLAQYGLD